MTVEQEIQRFKYDLLKKLPFYGDILLRVPISPDNRVPTAQTDGRSIKYKPAFFNKLSQGERNFVIMHEVLHIILLHPKRRGERDPGCWNVACDLLVNSMLERLMWSIKSAGIPFEPPKVGIFGMTCSADTAEELYERIIRANGVTKKSCRKIAVTCKQFRALDNVLRETTVEVTDDLVVIADEDFDERAVTDIVRDALQKNRSGMGNLFVPPRLLELDKSKKLNWRVLLRDLLSEEVSDDSSYATPERKYIHMDLIIPGHCTEETVPGEVWAFVDSSASISKNEMNEFLTQIYRLTREFGCEVNIAYWNTSVDDVYQHIRTEKQLLTALPNHSGGTNINCVYDWISAEKIKPDIMVILTDGYFGNLYSENFKRSYKAKTVLVLSTDIAENEDMKRIGRIARL